VARNNDQWRQQVLGEALVIVRGPGAYVSPSWYASKAEHGRVVPTWNYVTAHVYGRLIMHDDPDWVGALVRRLTDRHEADNPLRWSVDDAPASFVAGQLRAIVGVELVISRVEAKAKLSQNRPAADIDGVITGLEARGDTRLPTPCELLNEPDRPPLPCRRAMVRREPSLTHSRAPQLRAFSSSTSTPMIRPPSRALRLTFNPC